MSFPVTFRKMELLVVPLKCGSEDDERKTGKKKNQTTVGFDCSLKKIFEKKIK